MKSDMINTVTVQHRSVDQQVSASVGFHIFGYQMKYSL